MQWDAGAVLVRGAAAEKGTASGGRGKVAGRWLLVRHEMGVLKDG